MQLVHTLRQCLPLPTAVRFQANSSTLAADLLVACHRFFFFATDIAPCGWVHRRLRAHNTDNLNVISAHINTAFPLVPPCQCREAAVTWSCSYPCIDVLKYRISRFRYPEVTNFHLIYIKVLRKNACKVSLASRLRLMWSLGFDEGKRAREKARCFVKPSTNRNKKTTLAL